MIPGSNLLNIALRVIARQTVFTIKIVPDRKTRSARTLRRTRAAFRSSGAFSLYRASYTKNTASICRKIITLFIRRTTFWMSPVTFQAIRSASKESASSANRQTIGSRWMDGSVYFALKSVSIPQLRTCGGSERHGSRAVIRISGTVGL